LVQASESEVFALDQNVLPNETVVLRKMDIEVVVIGCAPSIARAAQFEAE
jgi:hypothetical protein